VTQPRHTSAERQRASSKAQLVALFGKLDRCTSDALLTVLEIVTDMDRRRARRLVEALALLVVFAPRRIRGGVQP
jgi:hypothetical protein